MKRIFEIIFLIVVCILFLNQVQQKNRWKEKYYLETLWSDTLYSNNIWLAGELTRCKFNKDSLIHR